MRLAVESVAHGGACVARHEGRTVFVRHALPGEVVIARLTEERERYARADAVEILEASPDRVDPPCPYARPGRCGGCDWQHASLPAQRRLKAAVVEEQLRRLAGIDVPVTVEPVPGDLDGLAWRTRVRFAVTPDGVPGLRRHRSNEVEPVERCLIAAPGVGDVLDRRWPGATEVESIAGSTGDRAAVVDGRVVSGRPGVRETALGRSWWVGGSGFWQVHPGAATVLGEAVVDLARPEPRDLALDLYGGVGLFAGALAPRAKEVVTVESDPAAVAAARQNLRDLTNVRVVEGRVDATLRRLGLGRAEVVVLDPPRSGAGAAVMELVAGLAPRAVVYVACDPVALARDIAGFRLVEMRAYDLFPMTHHVECVALLEPG